MHLGEFAQPRYLTCRYLGLHQRGRGGLASTFLPISSDVADGGIAASVEKRGSVGDVPEASRERMDGFCACCARLEAVVEEPPGLRDGPCQEDVPDDPVTPVAEAILDALRSALGDTPPRHESGSTRA
jgi:hypothetical protein